MKPELHLVPATPITETVSEKVRRLTSEAKTAASSHVLELKLSMSVTRETAMAIAEGGDSYPAGVRGVARDICRSLESQALILQTITERS